MKYLMASLVSLPIDCIIRILQSCDKLSQAIALSSTCKHLHSVYSSSSSGVIRHVGPREVFAFNEALMTVGNIQSGYSVNCLKF